MLYIMVIKPPRKREGKRTWPRPDRQYTVPISEKQAMIANGVFRKDV